jgi:hypothetical protein
MSKVKLTEEQKSERERMFVNYFFINNKMEQEILLRSLYNTLSNKLRNEMYEYMKQNQIDGEVQMRRV